MRKASTPSDDAGQETHIIRVVKNRNKPYTMIARELAEDSRISFEARGVLLYLLSKPDDWMPRNTDLQRNGNIGERQLARILRELKTAGYMRREKTRRADGRYDWSTVIYEEPPAPYCQNSGMEPYRHYPGMDNPSMDNPGVDNSGIYQRTNGPSTKKLNTKEREIAPTSVDIPTEAVPATASKDMQSTGRAIKPRPAKQTPLPNPYPLTEEMRVWAAMEVADLGDRIDAEHKKFCNNYWASAVTRATWRPMWENWMIRAVEEFAPKQKGSSNGSHYQSADELKADRWRQWAAVIAAEQADDGPETEPRQNLRLIG